ncbi:MAG TPA: 30S ribosomal protein S6 [Candidatus Hypogeohydataceae bacterium YC41]
MRTYEAMFLVDNTVATNDWDGAVRHVQEILQKGGAKVLNVEKWAERKLAYKVGPHKRGTYMLVYFEAPVGSIATIRRECQLSETIVRSLILKVEKKTVPSVKEQPTSPATVST